jgi:hypothetical protein
VPVVAGVLLVAIALAGIGLAVSGGVPALGEAAPSATPSVTPIPTPNWRPALLAAYQEACGKPLDRSELQGLTRTEAEALVAEATRECRDEGGGKGKGKGHGGRGGHGHD